ncbi:1,6-anhydro-N-acetylmuramyl-L-alanine amidase AmpD [Mangrovimicrobium sediminis]|uniref:1,6-anhydro-N-acetylmuramyl-L-alanine amidase AmpD n=1 Tax=Mangrovimicrobium sediminis TaxID=2562682 RepID=A0A4Z0M3F9_9GAMM|nr:1,6-anhydro-N-acetylmuramyl-L-alanine amidase AmpD [Haliea sp. SAOS-164]TGD74041.1 1,6-anhydro-N-acetylmuramyl-L-alanine amidase AmpD [Haliea sp. SAOS-164]
MGNKNAQQGESGVWLPQARRVPSANFDQRPAHVQPDLLVIHNISLPPGQFEGDAIERLFTNCLDWDAHPFFGEIRGLRVSAHLLIRRDGELLQFVPLDERAWHAGVSCHAGRENCNDYSIGIELEGTDELPFTQAQYAMLTRVTRELQRLYPGITDERIVGHCHIAPGRKTDPGPAFDWAFYLRSLDTPPATDKELHA